MKTRTIALMAVAALLGGSTSALAHGPHPETTAHGADPGVARQLAAAKRATAKFRSAEAARAAGYTFEGICVADPQLGGMGIHLANPELAADAELDIRRPEVLVYEPGRDGRLRLVSLEYFVPDADQDLSTNDDLPRLFGRDFDGPMDGHEPGMPIHYDLHVWLFKHNPAGLFAQFNPRVSC
jgi:hypothetical protein